MNLDADVKSFNDCEPSSLEMAPRRRRRLLYPPGDTNWTTVRRVAILPQYADDGTNLCNRETLEAFRAFMKYVAEQRLPGRHRGSRSLLQMTADVVMQNLSGIDDLEGYEISTGIVKNMWKTINKKCILNFHSWRVLGKFLSKELNADFGIFHYRETIRCPESPLRVYMDPLISKSFDFITALSIVVAFPVPDLVKLANIPNLGILEVIHPNDPDWSGYSHSKITDLLVRAWSREASSNGAFPVLRILRLWNHQLITEQSIQYLPAFPALGLFDVAECGFKDKEQAREDAEQLGWTAAFDVNIARKVASECWSASKTLPSRKVMGYSWHPTKLASGLLWHGANISRVTRSNSPGFVLDNEGVFFENFSTTAGSFLLAGESSHNWNAVFKSNIDEDSKWRSVDYELYRLTAQNNNTWESKNSWCWAQLGGVRDDMDLVRAGIKNIDKAALIGERIISPLPVAHIRLGKHPMMAFAPRDTRDNWTIDMYRRAENNKRSDPTGPALGGLSESFQKPTAHEGDWPQPGNLAFIRVLLPGQMTNIPTLKKYYKGNKKGKEVRKYFEPTQNGNRDTKEEGKEKERLTRRAGMLDSVRPVKKRNLGEVLIGFNLG